MKTINNYCVWSLKPSIDYPEASTFRYNQSEEEGLKLANEMTKNSWSESSQLHLKNVMPEVYAALKAKGHKGTIYYCTSQEYGVYGESLGPKKDDVIKAFNSKIN
ncbi:hypothetical protein [Chryseobacterium oncorhynchi]|uniref:Uncharacterized protein n=1 Tax=Chryseobacterium oncorhynchi TaxID=741074 RepID=A0A316WN89_9FLAO|nr:hypothetical protein [Chryseobacterium oncorhynchi]PWN60000.1 hypothetical protein C1638_020755 [Chryseobacterium oncorhynchi]